MDCCESTRKSGSDISPPKKPVTIEGVLVRLAIRADLGLGGQTQLPFARLHLRGEGGAVPCMGEQERDGRKGWKRG